MKSVDLHLSNGARVCIVGGGPAGSLAALHLEHFARRQGLRLEIFIFEPRDFSRPGPGGCNRCAGILSSRLLSGLQQLGLSLPTEIIQAELNAYTLCLDGEMLRIERPEHQRRIVSVYRGSGPRLLQGKPVASFDHYLLSQACARGAQLISARVRQVSWEGRPVVHTAQGRFPADLLVLATGVNSRSPLTPDYGYRPPKTEIMAQDEFLRPPNWPDDQVNIYFNKPPGLIFGALIPKGKYLNISLLGRGLTLNSVSDFIDAHFSHLETDPKGARPWARCATDTERPGLNTASLCALSSLCGCTPRVAVGREPLGRDVYFGDRWVAVGDAAVTRLYKDGIGSAFFTAKSAMEAAVHCGISRRAFQKTYAPFCRTIARDNLYGRFLFRIWSYTLRTPRLLHAWTNIVRQEVNRLAKHPVHIRILWGMFTGDELYRDLFWLSLSPRALYGLVRGWWDSR
jgi:flavin-dependent dehydrogenase